MCIRDRAKADADAFVEAMHLSLDQVRNLESGGHFGKRPTAGCDAGDRRAADDRQHRNFTEPKAQFLDDALGQKEFTAHCVVLRKGPVSYTHLDVYKRQEVHLLLLAVRQELVQRRIQETDRGGESLQGLEDSDEVTAMKGEQFGHGRLAG